MARNETQFSFDEEFAFYRQLWYYYSTNRGKITSRYNGLTKKYLDYNNPNENPNAFLRRPQFEALEMYVFIKEFLNNGQMYEIFDKWSNKKDMFSDASYYSLDADGQTSIFTEDVNSQNERVFRYIESYKADYPNYIYALTMGLGKTILMATCIFYEFLLAKKYPKDKRFCHNVLVFAPDKTVLQSLHEIMTFDKEKVVPPEYARVLDSNIRFHFLDDTGTTLNTLDDSNYNIIISNNQKIIVKTKHKELSAADKIFKDSSILNDLYGDNEVWAEDNLVVNQRFMKICRLPQLGVYVDEAHHLFGAKLFDDLHTENKTSLRNTINLLAKNTSIVACYNYTGTPYANNKILPEVVYAYGLRESIHNGYLKQASLSRFEDSDIKTEVYLRASINEFWTCHGGKEYEGLVPKLAIFAATVNEAVNVVKPAVEKILTELNIPISTILVNTGDTKVTKDEDIKLFNDLDVLGSEGSKKQFIILVQKGREGWNCRSLLGVVLFRSPDSSVFVLQATMRCLRQLTDKQLTACVFLSSSNYDILANELEKNYRMGIGDLKPKKPEPRNTYKVHMLPPERTVKMKILRHKYTLVEKEIPERINFDIGNLDENKYRAIIIRSDITNIGLAEGESDIDKFKDQTEFSLYTLVGEISRYMNVPCLTIEKLLRGCEGGYEKVLDAVNRHNEILYEHVVPTIFNSMYKIECTVETEDTELVLLREPKDFGYYEFSAKEELVVTKGHNDFTLEQIAKSFHADTYCFDSIPEKECFRQYITNNKVKEVYFTGMFTSANQGDLAIQYIDPDSKRLRNYYPDFLALMEDGTYRLIEVKGEHMIDSSVVQAKKKAAEEIAAESGIEYIMYPGRELMNHNVLATEKKTVEG